MNETSMYLFGYGSLVSTESAEKTLKRKISANQIHDAILPKYKRTWNANIMVEIEGEQHEVSFLNITPSHHNCYGVIFEVSNNELLQMDKRERGYERRTVEVICANKTVSAITYVFSRELESSGSVLAGYLNTLNLALSTKPEAYCDNFWRSTDTIPKNIIIGSYRFTNKAQNEATKR